MDESLYDGIHTGTVKKMFRNDSVGVPFGFIEDDNPQVDIDIFFRNFYSRYSKGDMVRYVVVPGKPNPRAICMKLI